MNEYDLQAAIEETALEPILLWMTKHGDRPDLSGEFEVDNALKAMLFFTENKLANNDFESGDLSPLGRRIADRIIESRTSGRLREDALERGLLRFVTEEEPLGTDSFIGQDIEGIAVTSIEHADTVETLHLAGQISGIESHGYDGLTRPEVTASGRRRMNQQGAPRNAASDRGTIITKNDNRYQNHVKGDVGQVAAGVEVTQSGNHATFDKQVGEARDKVSQLRQLLNEIENVPTPIMSAFNELEAVSKDEDAKQSMWTRAATAFSMAVMTVAGQEAYQKVMEVTGSLGPILGIGG